jgi:hypothetical protein
MADIAGLPYWEITFDEQGRPNAGEIDTLASGVPGQGVSDLMVFAHGWNNDRGQARSLYRRFFEQVPVVLPDVAGVGFVGVVWPAKRWADETIPGVGSPAAALAEAPGPVADAGLVADLKDVFPAARQRRALEELAGLLEERPADPAELRRFQSLMARLAEGPDAGEAGEDHGELTMVRDDPEEVFGRFARALPAPAGEGGAAGFGDVFGRLWNGAKEALRQLTYFEMKKRAGVVGQRGLGPLVGRLGGVTPQLRVHMIGHSFGARLAAFTLAGLPDPGAGASPVKSLLLIQGAFSHFAFADALPDDPGRGGALKGMASHVDGPLAASFSVHDLAVGKLYPLASMSSRDDAAGLDDALFRWGAMGHDGAQAVRAEELAMGPVGRSYQLAHGRFTNLNGNSVITQGGPPSGAHSDIFHPEVIWAAVCIAGLAGTP